MTLHQLHLFNALYLVVLIVVALLTRATVRRITGAIAGAAAFSLAALGIVALGERVRWWHFNLSWEPYFISIFFIDFALACATILLITWRVARRFGRRGLAVVLVFFMVVGPVRDYDYMARFPEWGAYSPGIAPVLAIAATYALLILLGQSVMRAVAGPAVGSPLARRPWEGPR
jgi:hypothetical protein